MTAVLDRPRRRLARDSAQRKARAAADPSVIGRTLLSVLGGLAGLGIWLIVFGLLLSSLTESHAQHDLYTRFRTELALGTAPLSDAVPSGSPVALLSASSGHLDDIVVVQGTAGSVLKLGPGHQPGVPLPGQPGVSEIMGRSTSYGAPFANITSMAKGDKLTAITGQGTFHYVVEDVRGPGDPFPPTLAPGGSQLTLVTSQGSGWRSGWAPSHAVFVDLILDGSTLVPPGTVGVAGGADGVLTHDTSGLYPLVLWLQLLALGVIGGIWARVRWGHWQSWITVAPVIVAALWAATSNFWPLLPNLM
jgi:sortase A